MHASLLALSLLLPPNGNASGMWGERSRSCVPWVPGAPTFAHGRGELEP